MFKPLVENALLEIRPSDKDLLYVCSRVGVKITVHDDVYDLIGEISSSSESNEEKTDQLLEHYFVDYYNYSNRQVMAGIKQTKRTETNHRGYPIATKIPRRDDSDSESSIESTARPSDPKMGKSKNRSPRKKPKKNAISGFTSKEGSTEDDNTPQTGGKGIGKNRKVLPKKPLQRKRPKKDISMKELTRQWNRTGRIGLSSETTKGWLKKTEKKRDDQRRVLRRAAPGVKALREIRHYQRCRTFLIAVLPFQRLVREVCNNSLYTTEGLRWQSNALFTVQSAAEAYMSGFYHDINLCALHRKVKTINRQDIWLAITIRGREHVGGKPQVTDVGACNISGYRVADASEKQTTPRGA